ncbi:alpha/beta fold hydrolase [Limnohabitans sp.]|jgi:carboxymethylenebutenolidase|uniref:dienelactone hydrolase family protein n=1 Tax=Limnohabitans sp. TaxID=1907725 RepID=UPI00289AD87C|nr:alpha/beta fold hydrolase [Limnohabitans sp.]
MTEIMGHYAELISPDKHRFRAFVAHPSKPARGVLVLLHEMDARSANRDSSAYQNPMPGLSQRIRALVNEHAARGYLVVAPSLFGRGRAGQHHGYKYQMASMGEQLLKPLQPVDSSLAMMDIETVVAWAQAQIPQGRVGIMGFCWGGLLAWQAACTLPQVFAATSFYGGGMTNPEVRSWRPMCPVLIHLPAKGALMTQESMDEFIAVQREHFSAHGQTSPGQKMSMVQIEQYNAAYGFDHAGSRQHDPHASQSARLKTFTFFDRYLNG